MGGTSSIDKRIKKGTHEKKICQDCNSEFIIANHVTNHVTSHVTNYMTKEDPNISNIRCDSCYHKWMNNMLKNISNDREY